MSAVEPARKIAFLFRYGLAEHLDFLPALPHLARLLRQGGAEVHHFGFASPQETPSHLASVISERRLPFCVHRASSTDKHLKALLWLAALPWLGRRLHREGFDTVFVDETLPLTAPLLRASFPGQLIFTIHDFFADIYLMPRPWLRPLGRAVKRADLQAWRRLDAIFTRVEAARSFLASQGIDLNRIRVAHDPVDLDRFRPGDRETARARFGFQPEEVVLVHHGILHPNKGNLRILESFAALRDRFPTLTLWIIGDGPELPQLRRRASALGLGHRVRLAGWLPSLSDIAAALRAADIGLVMRCGMAGDDFHVTSTLVHNMASGLPILAARLLGIAEVVREGVDGFLFDPACGAEFADKLALLVTDPSLRERMGAQARKTAEERFAPDRIARIYAEVLLGISGGGGASAS